MRKDYSTPHPEPLSTDPAVVNSKHVSGVLLVVDDDDTSRDMLSLRLKDQGHVALGTAGGYQAMEMLKAASFDLILLDIMMPEIDGYQVLEQLKSDATLRHIPVIMLTGLDDNESAARCIEIGADDYLTKPVKSFSKTPELVPALRKSNYGIRKFNTCRR